MADAGSSWTLPGFGRGEAESEAFGSGDTLLSLAEVLGGMAGC